MLLLILAQLTRWWRAALHVVSPDPLLRWHRDLFKIVWRRKSKPRGQPKRLAREVVTLIQAMAKDNVLWGAERFLGSARRECLDKVVVLSERQLRRILRAYVETYFSIALPHQGLDQRLPRPANSATILERGRKVVAIPILGGLHHDYRWAA